MNRRGFFKMLAGAAGAIACAPLLKVLPAAQIKPALIGSTANIRFPQRWTPPQGTLNLDQVFGVHFEWDSYEKLINVARDDQMRLAFMEDA